MSEMSDMHKLIMAMELAKTARVGMELTYFDVIELLGELDSLKSYIAELEAEKCVLIDQQREVKNHLIDKNLHIDSLYDEGYKLQQRIAELERDFDMLFRSSANKQPRKNTQSSTIVYGKEREDSE